MDEIKEIFTPKTLFAEHTACTPIENVQIVSSQVHGGVTTEKLYFDGFAVGEGKSILYATVCYVKLPAPSILLLGHIGKPLDTLEEEMRFWAYSGYCAVALDLGGDAGKGAHTIYPDELQYCNVRNYDRRLYYCDGNAKETVWYHYCLNCMRAVTLIKQQYSGENPIFMLSMGGKACKTAVQTLATDKRIDCACIAFGNLLEQSERTYQQSEDSAQEVADMEENERWLAGVCTQAYLPYITQNVYVITGANGADTDVEAINSAMLRFGSEQNRQLFFAYIVDAVTPQARAQIRLWFDFDVNKGTLPPKPNFELRVTDGHLYVIPSAFPASVCYASADKPIWFYLEVEQTQGGCEIPVYDNTKPLRIYCNTEQNSFWSSSDIITVNTDTLSEVRCSNFNRLLCSAETVSGGLVPLEVHSDAIITCNDTVRKQKGALGIEGYTGRHFGTFILSEYSLKFICGSQLTLDIYSETAQMLSLYLVTDWASKEQEIFSTDITLLGGEMWQKVSVSPREFKSKQGKTIEAQLATSIDALILCAEDEIFVHNILLS